MFGLDLILIVRLSINLPCVLNAFLSFIFHCLALISSLISLCHISPQNLGQSLFPFISVFKLSNSLLS